MRRFVFNIETISGKIGVKLGEIVAGTDVWVSVWTREGDLADMLKRPLLLHGQRILHMLTGEGPGELDLAGVAVLTGAPVGNS